jgi:hypothetical protein
MNPAFSKRSVVKRAGVGPIKVPQPVTNVVSDITGGFRELQRQMGSAAGTIKSGVQKIKASLK